MKKQLQSFALFTCIIAATAFGGQTAFADYGSPGEQPEARLGQHQKHKGHRGGQFFKKMASELGLSDQQKKEAKELFEASRAQHKPLLETMRTEKRQLQTLVHTGNADEAAIRAQAAKVATIESDLAVQRGQQAKQFLALLTPDQAAKFKELKSRHKGDVRGFEGCQEGPGE